MAMAMVIVKGYIPSVMDGHTDDDDGQLDISNWHLMDYTASSSGFTTKYSVIIHSFTAGS